MANLLRRALRPRSVGTFGGLEPFTVNGNTYMGMPAGPAMNRELPSGDFMPLVQNAYRSNGPVFACMLARQLVFSEARFKFRRMNQGRPGDLFDTDALRLLDNPWTGGSTGDLLTRMIQDADLGGNAFFARRDGGLRRLRPDWVTIITGSRSDPGMSGDDIDAELVGYMYQPAGPGSSADTEILLPHEVAHFAPIPDPLFNFRGMSWLSPVIREMSSDNAATLHKLKFFENGASPQIVVAMDASVTPEHFERFKAKMDAEHAGVANAYKTMYVGGGADVTVAGKDLRELDFKATQGGGETRIAAAAAVPPIIVGLSEGLQSATYSNYGQARRRFADGTLSPLWRQAAGALSQIVDVPADAELWYDTTDIPFLREDRLDAAQIQAQQSQTIRTLVDAGFTPESVISAVNSEDYSLLEHTGWYSVQLQRPGQKPASEQAAIEPSSDTSEA